MRNKIEVKSSRIQFMWQIMWEYCNEYNWRSMIYEYINNKELIEISILDFDRRGVYFIFKQPENSNQNKKNAFEGKNWQFCFEDEWQFEEVKISWSQKNKVTFTWQKMLGNSLERDRVERADEISSRASGARLTSVFYWVYF